MAYHLFICVSKYTYMCINSKVALIWIYYADFLSEYKILLVQLEKKIAVSVHHMH